MRSILNTKKKGQVGLEEAPTIILIVGLVFLIMATIALIGERYGDAIPSDNSKTVVNETLTTVNSSAVTYVVNTIGTHCNYERFTVIAANNGSDVIPASNYTVDADGGLSCTGTSEWNATNWNVTYSFNYAGVACNITSDLQTEVGNNTSIAGIVLTISLVGIVLSILIGVFFGIRKVRSRI